MWVISRALRPALHRFGPVILGGVDLGGLSVPMRPALRKAGSGGLSTELVVAIGWRWEWRTRGPLVGPKLAPSLAEAGGLRPGHIRRARFLAARAGPSRAGGMCWTARA